MRPESKQTWAFILVVVAGTLLAYQPIWHAGFIWDDNLFLLGNPLLKQSDGWWRVWRAHANDNDYVPALASTWWLEWRLWQNNPPAFHLVTLLWHVLDSLLLWRVLRRLQIPGAGLAAALFALHPVNVETAAWVAEQRSTEAMFFFLGAILCQLQFEDTGNKRWFGLAAGAFALGLGCKAAVSPLPVVLLGIAWWRHGKLGRRDVLHSVPFFVLAAMETVVAIWIQSHGVLQTTTASIGWLTRLARAGDAVWFYLFKDLLPINLISIYPKWAIDAGSPLSYLPGLMLVILFVALWGFRRSGGRPLLFGLGYFVLMLLPVLGFVDISLMRYTWVADHWQYFAIIGPVALLAAGIDRLARKNAAAGWVLVTFLLTACGVLTWRQARIYQSGDAFWAEFMRVNQPAIAAYNAGKKMLAQGRTDQAVTLFRKAVELQPAFSLPYNSMGELLLQTGQLDDALPLEETAIELRPDFPEAQKNLGRILLARNEIAEALDHLQRSADLQPHDAEAQYDFGKVLLQVGLAADAATYFQKALAIQPTYVEALNDLGSAFEETGRYPDAANCYQKALDARDDFIPACNNLAWLFATAPTASLRNGAKAIELAQRANDLSQGKNPLILETLAAAYAETGKFNESVKTIDRALKLAAGNSTLTALLQHQGALYKRAKRLYEK